MTSVRRFLATFLKNNFHLQQKCLTGFAKSDYKEARLMNERFILHIKTFDSKRVCFYPLADWASPVTNQMLSRVVRG